jgi:hypothetical protein
MISVATLPSYRPAQSLVSAPIYQEHDMAARRNNARKKDKRRRHAGTRKAQREAAAALVQDAPQQPRRPSAQAR